MSSPQERYRVEVNGQIEEFEGPPGLGPADIAKVAKQISQSRAQAENQEPQGPPGFGDYAAAFGRGLARETGAQDLASMTGMTDPAETSGHPGMDVMGGVTAKNVLEGLGVTAEAPPGFPGPESGGAMERTAQGLYDYLGGVGWSPENVDPEQLADAAGGAVGMTALPWRLAGRAAGAAGRGVGRATRPFVGPTAAGARAATTHLGELGSAAARRVQDEVATRFPGMPMSSEDAHAAFMGVKDQIGKASREAQDAVFREIDQLTPGATMDVTDILRSGEDMIRDMTDAVAGKSPRAARKILKEYPEEMQRLYAEITNLRGAAGDQNLMPISMVDAARDRWSAFGRQFSSPQFRKLGREAKRVQDEVIDGMAEQNPRLAELWNEAKGFRQGARDSTVLAQLAQTDPDSFSTVIRGMKPSTVRKTRELLGDQPEIMATVAQGYADDIAKGGDISAIREQLPQLRELLGRDSGAYQDVKKLTHYAEQFENAVTHMDNRTTAAMGRALNSVPGWARLGGGVMTGTLPAMAARQMSGWLAARSLRDPQALELAKQLSNAVKSGERRRMEHIFSRVGRLMGSTLTDEGPDGLPGVQP